MSIDNASPERIQRIFTSRFGEPELLIASPGRVNIIGEHTDYNLGFVMPGAINKVIMVAMAKNQLNIVRAFSVDMNEEVEFALDAPSPTYHWAKYIYGAVQELLKNKHRVSGIDLVFGGNIPIGAGLSSSAALEGGVLTGLNTLFNLELSRKELALTGQQIEHHYVGVKCGVMDQFANLHSQAGHVLKLDCRTLEYEAVPFERDDIYVVLCNSKVSHNLASSEYNVRRAQCEEGVQYFRQFDENIRSLRDVSPQLFAAHSAGLDPLIRRRCKFVLEENARVQSAGEYLKNNDFESLGQELLASHYGLSKDYEVSCSELDALVEIAKKLPGVLGCRMMGGGFGGCTINLVQQEFLENFTDVISEEYKKQIGLETEIYVTRIGEGAHVL